MHFQPSRLELSPSLCIIFSRYQKANRRTVELRPSGYFNGGDNVDTFTSELTLKHRQIRKLFQVLANNCRVWLAMMELAVKF
jgi:hypothetical protein